MDEGRVLCLLAVAPDAADRHDVREMGSEPTAQLGDHLAHRGADAVGGRRSGGLAGLCKKEDGWHAQRLPRCIACDSVRNLGSGRAITLRRVTRILIVRHGQSEWNADGRWQGRADPPLTDLGREQAFRAARAVGALDAICSSPLDRAATTASVIAEEIGVGPVRSLPALVERDAGAWQGLTRDEIEEQYPGWLAEQRRPPGWEPDDLVEARAMHALDQIAEEHAYGHVLAVAHAGVIFALERVLGAPWERLANLGGRWVERTDGRWLLGERVHLLVEETIPDQI